MSISQPGSQFTYQLSGTQLPVESYEQELNMPFSADAKPRISEVVTYSSDGDVLSLDKSAGGALAEQKIYAKQSAKKSYGESVTDINQTQFDVGYTENDVK